MKPEDQQDEKWLALQSMLVVASVFLALFIMDYLREWQG